MQKEEKNKSRHFNKRIDPEVDEKVNEALFFAEKGRFSRAKEILEGLLSENPDIHTVHYGIGTLHSLQKNYEEALIHYDKAISIYPYYPEVWFNKAVIHKENFQVVEMIESFRKAIEYGDSNEDYVIQAKEILYGFSRNLYENNAGISIDDFIRATGFFKKGFSFMEKGEWTKAIDEFSQALKIQPNHTQSYGNLGLCFAQLGQKQKALDALNKALSIDPNYEPAIINKKMFESMTEGVKPTNFDKLTVDYYKDQFKKNIGEK